jgi:heme/copper-type cytochrome/quinol oxidase subunit 2
MRRNVVLWVLPLVALAVLAAAMTFLLITLPPRQQTISSDAGRSIFWYWFIASFVVVYVYLLLFVFEEEEG